MEAEIFYNLLDEKVDFDGPCSGYGGVHNVQ